LLHCCAAVYVTNYTLVTTLSDVSSVG
jgi:hypothetical protein